MGGGDAWRAVARCVGEWAPLLLPLPSPCRADAGGGSASCIELVLDGVREAGLLIGVEIAAGIPSGAMVGDECDELASEMEWRDDEAEMAYALLLLLLLTIGIECWPDCE